jgi:hypothetical protein
LDILAETYAKKPSEAQIEPECGCPPSNCSDISKHKPAWCNCMNQWDRQCKEQCPSHKMILRVSGFCRPREIGLELTCDDQFCNGDGVLATPGRRLKSRQENERKHSLPESDDPVPVQTIECGSRGLPNCKDGYQCVTIPGARCGPDEDCGGMCVKSNNRLAQRAPECGSRGLPNCKDGYQCVSIPGAKCGPAEDCGGMCVKSRPPAQRAPECGSRGLPGCKTGRCVKMPGASCGPEADCGGYCTGEVNDRKPPRGSRSLGEKRRSLNIETQGRPRGGGGGGSRPAAAAPKKPASAAPKQPASAPRPAAGGAAAGYSALAAPMAPRRPAVLACKTDSSCPSAQMCVRKHGLLDDARDDKSSCVGSTCFLAPRSPSEQRLCPSGQLCVRKPCKGLEESPTDVPGICASKDMTCHSDDNCPSGWRCQKHPNGDGSLCPGGDPDCGLCIHFGDGQCSRHRYL